MNILIDDTIYTEEKLRIIIAQSNAVQILIQSVKRSGDHKAISDWDMARRVKNP